MTMVTNILDLWMARNDTSCRKTSRNWLSCTIALQPCSYDSLFLVDNRITYIFSLYRITLSSQLRYDVIFGMTIYFVGTHSINPTSLTCTAQSTTLPTFEQSCKSGLHFEVARNRNKSFTPSNRSCRDMYATTIYHSLRRSRVTGWLSL